MMRVHATCVSLSGIGVLLRGPSGAGKSDLALRLVDGGALLVADDQVLLAAEGGRLVARPPRGLAGLLEVRGVGILPVPTVEEAPVLIVADLAAPGEVERLPETDMRELAGVAVRHLRIAPFEASAPAKLRLAAATVAASLPFIPNSLASAS